MRQKTRNAKRKTRNGLRVLTIDVGTSAVKAGYWDGERFARMVRVPMTVKLDGAQAELPVKVALAAVELAGREAMRGQAAPEAVAFDVFSSAVVVTDKAGKATVGAITHQDRRSVESAEEIVAEFGEAWLLKRVGNLPFPGGIGSSTLRWLRKNSTVLKGAGGVGQLSSLLGRHLTGRWVIDPSQACFLGLMEIGTRAWNKEICKFVGVDVGTLPRIEFADEVLGMTLGDISRRWGIRAGTPVVGGFVDTSGAIVNTPMTPGQLVHNAGSTDVLALCVAKARPKANLLTRPVGVGRVFAERWLSVSTIASAGSAIDWARRELFAGVSDLEFARALRRACQSDPGLSPGLRCEPWFAGDRTSLVQKRAEFAGLTLGTTREEMLAAIVAALARESAARYGELAKVQKIGREVLTMGGATEMGAAMHRAWALEGPGRHRFVPMEGEALAGLVRLAEAALAG